MRRTLRISSISHMLRNPFYYGAFYHKGVLEQGSHAPMISKDTWDKIQLARAAVAKPRKRKGEKGLLFLNLATCGSCGHCITGERHRKKSGLEFHYYRCTHKNAKRGCQSTTYLRQEKVAEEVKRNIRLVTLPAEWKEKFLAKIELWEAEGSKARSVQIERVTTDLDAVKAKVARLNDAFTDGQETSRSSKNSKIRSSRRRSNGRVKSQFLRRPERIGLNRFATGFARLTRGRNCFPKKISEI